MREEGKARKGKERKGKERKGKERKGKERKGKERKGKERKGKERKGKERKGKERKGKERKGKERKGKERKGKERKGKERKGKERKGKERKGKERKGKEERADRNRSLSTIARTGPFLLFACVETPLTPMIPVLCSHVRVRQLPATDKNAAVGPWWREGTHGPCMPSLPCSSMITSLSDPRKIGLQRNSDGPALPHVGLEVVLWSLSKNRLCLDLQRSQWMKTTKIGKTFTMDTQQWTHYSRKPFEHPVHWKIVCVSI